MGPQGHRLCPLRGCDRGGGELPGTHPPSQLLFPAFQIKKAFFALVANGVRAAPLWDSKKQSFVGKERLGRHRWWEWKGDTSYGSRAVACPQAKAISQPSPWPCLPLRDAHHHRLHRGAAPILQIPPGEEWVGLPSGPGWGQGESSGSLVPAGPMSDFQSPVAASRSRSMRLNNIR